MRPTPPSPSPQGVRRLAVALAATALLAVPAAAVAAPEGEPSSASEDAAGCADHLVTLRPDGVEGHDRAVGITAQTLDAGLPGWAYATWQTAPGTTLTAIITSSADGSTSRLPVSDSGEAVDVVALTFCGSAVSADGPLPIDAEPERSPSAASSPTAETADRGVDAGTRPVASDTHGNRAPTDPEAASDTDATSTGVDSDGPDAHDEAVTTSIDPMDLSTATPAQATGGGSWWQRLPDADRRAAPNDAHAVADTARAVAQPASDVAIGTTLIRSEGPAPAGGSDEPIGVVWLLAGLVGATAWLPIRRLRRSRPHPTTTWG
jgi:hypothetical protein